VVYGITIALLVPHFGVFAIVLGHFVADLLLMAAFLWADDESSGTNAT
jgi:hypothetical protein